MHIVVHGECCQYVRCQQHHLRGAIQIMKYKASQQDYVIKERAIKLKKWMAQSRIV